MDFYVASMNEEVSLHVHVGIFQASDVFSWPAACAA